MGRKLADVLSKKMEPGKAYAYLLINNESTALRNAWEKHTATEECVAKKQALINQIEIPPFEGDPHRGSRASMGEWEVLQAGEVTYLVVDSEGDIVCNWGEGVSKQDIKEKLAECMLISEFIEQNPILHRGQILECDL